MDATLSSSRESTNSRLLVCQAGGLAASLSFPLAFGRISAGCRLKKIEISILRPQTDVLDKENVSKNTKAMCHSGFLTDSGKR